MCDCRNVTMGVRLSAGTHEELRLCGKERFLAWERRLSVTVPIPYGYRLECRGQRAWCEGLKAEVRECDMRVLRQK